MRTFSTAVLIWLILSCPAALAWSNRGHQIICVAATRLVHNEELRDFLAVRMEQAAHLCNIPDIFWKSGKEQRAEGSSSHYINLDVLGLTPETVPESYEDLIKLVAPKLKRSPGNKIKAIAKKVGSLWWRADQFFQLAVGEAKIAKKSPIPEKSYGPDKKKSPYEEAVFAMWTDMGLMGHFVGDASMPYHNTSDRDGWKKGHGGIHTYYEMEVIDAMDFNLLQRVYERASKLPPPAKAGQSVIERMRALSIAAVADIPKVEEKDKIITPSADTQSDEEDRVPAKRPPAEAGAKAFDELIVDELARSARVLADLWDEVLVQGDRPSLKLYRSGRYPITPEFVAPNYIPMQKPAQKSGKKAAVKNK